MFLGKAFWYVAQMLSTSIGYRNICSILLFLAACHSFVGQTHSLTGQETVSEELGE